MGSKLVVKPCGTHIAKRFVVSVRFAIGANAHKLRFATVCIPSALDAVSERSCVAEQMFKSDGTRKPRVVEEHIEVSVANEVSFLVAGVNAVRTSRVDVRVTAIGPFFIAKFAELFRLRRRKNRELDARLDEFDNSLEIDGGFGKPHSFGHATEMELEIFNAPADLRTLILFACERHDDMVIDLGNGVAVAFQTFLAAFVGFLETLVCVRRVGANPPHERGADIEAHEIVVVDNIGNFAIGI